MPAKRIAAIVVRQFYLMKGSFSRVSPVSHVGHDRHDLMGVYHEIFKQRIGGLV